MYDLVCNHYRKIIPSSFSILYRDQYYNPNSEICDTRLIWRWMVTTQHLQRKVTVTKGANCRKLQGDK